MIKVKVTYTTLAIGVALFKEIWEEDEEENPMSTDPPGEYYGEIAFDEEKLEGVSEDSNKLNLYRKNINLAANHLLRSH